MDEILLLLAGGGFVTGEAMCRTLGISRMAVHKRIEGLRALGIEIEARSNRGYRLVRPGDVLAAPLLSRELTTAWAGRPMRCLPQVASTNLVLKEMAEQGAPHGQLVLAETQEAGRGRRGRGWVSQPWLGLWSSLLVRPPVPPAQASGLTVLAAMAVCDAVSSVYALDPGIKWPNDVVLSGRKLTGILVELHADLDSIYWAVVGVGINVNHAAKDFPEELRDKATSLALVLGRQMDRGPLLRAYLTAFEARYQQWIDGGFAALEPDYRRYSRTLGQTVRVESLDKVFIGTAEELDELGALLVRREDGTMERVLAGDVSVRGLMGYVD